MPINRSHFPRSRRLSPWLVVGDRRDLADWQTFAQETNCKAALRCTKDRSSRRDEAWIHRSPRDLFAHGYSGEMSFNILVVSMVNLLFPSSRARAGKETVRL
jgi:hypothetical protein